MSELDQQVELSAAVCNRLAKVAAWGETCRLARRGYRFSLREDLEMALRGEASGLAHIVAC
jgi:hypothetical protein